MSKNQHKTLGQVAYEAAVANSGDVRPWNEVDQGGWEAAAQAVAAAIPADAGCICKGNWRAIVAESEPLLDKKFRDQAGKEHIFYGVVLGSDDFYYGMLPMDGGKPILLSCVGSIEGYGYALVAD